MNAPSKAKSTPSQVPGLLSPKRLERLADIVFALALLLLLVTIDFAPEESTSSGDAYAYLWKQSAQSLGFVVSFLIIAYYWMSHQEYFAFYKTTNKTHTFVELLYLMTIAGMPFKNHFIAAFPTELAPRLAISSDIFAAGLLAFLSWSYATKATGWWMRRKQIRNASSSCAIRHLLCPTLPSWLPLQPCYTPLPGTSS